MYLIRIIVIIAIGTLASCSTNKKVAKEKPTNTVNTIKFEVSPYGLLFTQLEIDGESVKSMIDFGDPNILQISSTFVKKKNLQVKETNMEARDINGNSFKVNQGTLNEVKIGNASEKNILFSSSPNEMESVSKQIGTIFNAVVGWGYFKQHFVTVNYSKKEFLLRKNTPSISNPKSTVMYPENSSYLIIPIVINGVNTKAIIDTGSPVSVIDAKFQSSLEKDVNGMNVGELEVQEQFHAQDLSMLSAIDKNAKVILGGTFLEKYQVHINPKEHKIILE